MNPEIILHLLLWPPLIGFILNGIFGAKFPKWLVTAVACLMPLISFMGTCLAYTYLSGRKTTINLYTWFVGEGSAKVEFGFLIDNLSILMLFIVTGVGTLIHVYSSGYMAEDKGYPRFMSYMNLFMFSMLMLVLGSNLVVLFAGWEGVGLCSFLLIGYWYENLEYNKAAAKAFIMNRIGDLAFLIAIFMTIYSTGAVNFEDIRETVTSGINMNEPVMVVIALLFFIGVCGKSAQIPLFTWLPDAMAGPTPVSALIHAATMVTAGIYLVTRMNFIFEVTPIAKYVIAVVGCLTAFVSASIALKQNDIKKILAYSTVSQLGYMAVALGVGAYITAIFHLMTHAFFKALLFLGAGSVIHGLHGEQDIRKMGGLKSKMKWTYATMLLGTLAIIGCPPFAGFFSKDEILAAVYSKNFWLFLILAITSVFTAWYMLRMFFSTFHGNFRGREESFEHIHESPWNMRAVLVVLAFLSVVGGFAGMPEISGQSHKVYQFLSLAVDQVRFKVSHLFEYVLWGTTVVALVVLFIVTFKRYTHPQKNFAASSENLLVRFIENKYYLDECYDFLFVQPLKKLGKWFMHTFEYKYVDKIVSIPVYVLQSGSFALRNLQNGKLSWYLLYSIIGLLIILVAFLII